MSDQRRPEEMADFFDTRADTYDAHQKGTIVAFDELYRALVLPIGQSRESVALLDLGCGTGLELEHIFRRAPNAVVTCVDLSSNMLEKLQEKYRDRAGQLKIVQKSYLSMEFAPASYDYVISVMTLHHLLHDTKSELYRKILGALKPGGKYIEGDYVVTTPERETELLQAYFDQVRELDLQHDGTHHIDIPFSIETQMQLLAEAGFDGVEVTWRKAEAAVLVGVRA